MFVHICIPMLTCVYKPFLYFKPFIFCSLFAACLVFPSCMCTICKVCVKLIYCISNCVLHIIRLLLLYNFNVIWNWIVYYVDTLTLLAAASAVSVVIFALRLAFKLLIVYNKAYLLLSAFDWGMRMPRGKVPGFGSNYDVTRYRHNYSIVNFMQRPH